MNNFSDSVRKELSNDRLLLVASWADKNNAFNSNSTKIKLLMFFLIRLLFQK